MSGKKYRVIQWSTGNVGGRSLEHLIDHPDYELVGLYSKHAAADGSDAGDLVGKGKTGVIASDSLDEIVALDADCVVYMRQGVDVDEVCALLSSGKNIVTTAGFFHHPAAIDPAVRERVEAACREGNTSIYATGSSPGFISEAFTIPLLAQQREFECLTIDEFADVSGRNSPEMLFQIMGFGAEPGPVDERKTDHVKHGFAGTLGQIADAIGRPVDSFNVYGEEGVAANDIEIAAGTVPKGKVAATRTVIEAMQGGKPFLRFRANWYVSTDIDQDWDLRESGWRVVVEGDQPLDIAITYPIERERYDEMTPNITANRAVNAVPTVCAAEPGIRTTVDLPHVIPTL